MTDSRVNACQIKTSREHSKSESVKGEKTLFEGMCGGKLHLPVDEAFAASRWRLWVEAVSKYASRCTHSLTHTHSHTRARHTSQWLQKTGGSWGTSFAPRGQRPMGKNGDLSDSCFVYAAQLWLSWLWWGAGRVWIKFDHVEVLLILSSMSYSIWFVLSQEKKIFLNICMCKKNKCIHVAKYDMNYWYFVLWHTEFRSVQESMRRAFQYHLSHVLLVFVRFYCRANETEQISNAYWFFYGLWHINTSTILLSHS